MNLTEQNEESESDIMKKIEKDYFFKMLIKEEIDLKKVCDKQKNNNTDFHNFNIIVKHLCDKKKLSISECAIYLLTDFFDINDTLECFDQDNMYELKYELSIKFNKKMDMSMLNYLLS